MFRLRTVRRKLLSLVGLSIVVTLAMLPVLYWLLHEQLLAEANDRVKNARRAYTMELDDRTKTLQMAATLMASDGDVAHAIHTGDHDAANHETQDFAKQFPEIDVLLIDAEGKEVSRIGCDGGTEVVDAKGVVKDALAGKPAEGMSGRGCAKERLPTYFVARPVPGGGAIVVGREFTKDRLERSGHKVGLELALVDPKGVLVNKTDHFPAGGEKVVPNDPMLITIGSSTYVVEPFTSDKLTTRKGNKYWLVAARDVTHVRGAIYRDLAIALAFVVAAALIAAAVGFRVADIMANALKRVSDALKRLEQQEYVKVMGVTTGDELEDLADGFNTMVEGLQERDKLKTTFGKYMTEAVMDHLLAGKVQLGGESLTATILFSDIRSFTSISEKMDAKALLSLLNEYFTEMVDVVIKEDGVVDKYIGDAIMAVFGAPVMKADDAFHAVRAAVGMRKALAALNEKLVARGMSAIKTGIGIHTGEVVAGNIGSEKRMEYTVIGDAVNLASRLESSTKELGAPVLISQDTYDLVKDRIEARAVKEITVKGREQPVMTYEVLGLKP
ncbi:MAG TPA: adenylate/guanylate cyclase domain-containing protein [Polyangiaceae bacterium]|jgi:adenylate cyclase